MGQALRTNDLIDGASDFTIAVPGVVSMLAKGLTRSELELKRPIGGVCSTSDLDRQSEYVLAKGLDFSEFIHHGWFNDNHKQDTTSIVGTPRLAELRKGVWYTEGNLFPPGTDGVNWPLADQIWQLAKVLERSGNRRLGFSIEGKVVDRDRANRITKAIIRMVAITHSPVNTNCSWNTLAKAFAPREVMAAQSFQKSLTAVTRGLDESSVARVAKVVRERYPHLSADAALRVSTRVARLTENRRS